MTSKNICKRSFGFIRKSGILMPVSSLPSPYGIGGFGEGAKKFIDFLDEAKQKCWQVLPLNPTSYGDSPYQSPASVAINPYFIDPAVLFEKKLITKGELELAKNGSAKIDYGWLFETRIPLLKTAFSRFKPDAKYRAFLRRSAFWIEDYALFMALRIHYNYKPWTEWEEEHKNYNKAINCKEKFSKDIDFWKWVQFECSYEWNEVKAYANAKDISIIGDMPIYVAHDSMDVWRSPEQFLLDDSFAPTRVAGCPPDAYSEDGQLWGNPIYNWELMEKQDFGWWCERCRAAFDLYDILRIDHFRGFASYYSIPYEDENAKRGEWVEAPGLALFKKIKERYPKSKIIAEDLGFITDDVRELLAKTEFPGMKLLQFAFFNDESEYLPRTYTTDNCIVYTASHDSDCTRSWASSLDKETKARFLRECKPSKGQSKTEALITLAMMSRANLAVIPMQDYLELTNEEGRMNTPSIPYGNWGWRISPRALNKRMAHKIEVITEKSKRAK